MSTFNAEERNMQNIEAIINGEFNFDGLSYSFRQQPFSFYIKRFVAERKNPNFATITDDDINNVTFEDTKDYIESIIEHYPEETREELNKLYSQVFKRNLRKVFTYEDDCRTNKNAYEELLKVPKDYEVYTKLLNKKHKTSEEKELLKTVKDKYGFVEKRKFTRKSLLDLFFLFDCNDEEAIDLFHRLGEQSFYSKDRNEMLIWWALKENANKYGKYLSLKEKGLLESPQVAINFDDMATGDFTREFLKCKTDFDFEHVVLKLSVTTGNRGSVRKLYLNIINAIDKMFNSYFRTKTSNKKIKDWDEQIARYSEQLFTDGITKKEQTTAYNAIETRERYKSEEKRELYNKIISKPAVSVLNKRFSEFMKSENLEGVTEMVRINRIRANENAEITRNDIITAYFIKTVLEHYYDSLSFELLEEDNENLAGKALFNTQMLKELSDSEVIDIVLKFQNNIDGLLMKYNYMPLNYLNEFESYLLVCLASRNPLKYFCKTVSVFEMFDD